MKEGQFRALEIFFQFSFTLLMAGLAGGLAELSYLKSIGNFCERGQHPSAFANWMLLVASPAIQFLQRKSLWELVPAFQTGTPFSISNVPFWIAVFVLVRVIRTAVDRFHVGRNFGRSPGNILGSLWRSHFMNPGTVTNYMVMINGPVTNSITAQTVGAVSQQALQLPGAVTEPEKIASDLERLLQAIANDGRLLEDQKKEARDLISTIAEEAKRPKKERKPAVIKALLNAIPVVISTAKSLMDLWIEIQPHLASFFL